MKLGLSGSVVDVAAAVVAGGPVCAVSVGLGGPDAAPVCVCVLECVCVFVGLGGCEEEGRTAHTKTHRHRHNTTQTKVHTTHTALHSPASVVVGSGERKREPELGEGLVSVRGGRKASKSGGRGRVRPGLMDPWSSCDWMADVWVCEKELLSIGSHCISL